MSEKVESLKVYFTVFGVLLVLLGVTVAASFVNLGPKGNFIFTMTIAVSKALIIALYFMHLRHSNSLVWIFASAGLIWLAILFVPMMADYLSRGWLPAPEGWMR